jgi:PAS domain S-box-containing protein
VTANTTADQPPHALEAAETAQRKLELLVNTGLLLAKSVDLQTMVQAATDAGLELCGAQFGAFFYNVRNASGESYLLYTLSGADREDFSLFPMPRNTAVFAPTFESTSVVRSGDITKDPRYGKNSPHGGMPQGHLPVHSYLAVPVQGQSGEVLGGLFYGHEKTDVFAQDAEDLVSTVAAQAAIAIENFRLREQLSVQIDDLKKAEILRGETAKHMGELAAIVESSDDAIISKDLNGYITNWNRAAARIFGYAPDEIVGRSILTLIPLELQSEEQVILEKIRAGQRVDHYETVRITKHGERLDVSLSVSPVRDASGTIIGASKILRDISSRKKLENSIVQAEKIAATGRMAATLAHEINNPLEAVVNLLYLARASTTDSRQVDQFLLTAENEVHRISHIARQTLGFYREHASAVRTTLSSLVEDTVRVYEPKCRSIGIRIKTKFVSSSKIVLRKGEMLQIISNLVTNAIYAMPTGGVLSIAVEDTIATDRHGVLLTVQDNGVGIPPEHLQRIFEPFFTTRGSVGTGIGLFVAKQFVEGHAGNIEVRSSVDAADHGTTFSIFLPLETPYSTQQA